MRARTAIAALAACALVAAGCGGGDDDDATRTAARTTAEGGTLKADVEPRANRPNIRGGDAPIEEFVDRVSGDVINYFEQAFTANGLPYEVAEVRVVKQAERFCGQHFDPRFQLYFYCWIPTTTAMAISGPRIEAVRLKAGDAGAAFLTAFVVAMDANAKLGPNPWAPNSNVGPEFDQQATCFVGAWIRNVNDRQLLDAGDLAEVEEGVGLIAGTRTVNQRALELGYNEGITQCRVKIKGEQGS